MPSLPQGFDKCMPAFFKGPIIEILIINKIGETPRKKVIGDELGGASMVVEDPRKTQLRATETEIDRRLCSTDDKLRQIVTCCQPGENAITIPAPRDVLGLLRGRGANRALEHTSQHLAEGDNHTSPAPIEHDGSVYASFD